MTDYERDTLNAYRNPERAAAYKRFQATDWTWGRIVTWFEQRAVARELARYDWRPTDRLLDIPCGAGVLGKVLNQFPFQIVASDISAAMIDMARAEYPADRLVSCTEADITKTPFPRESFACVVVLGFLHRVPPEIKRAALREIAALANHVVIISCSVDTPLWRFKQAVLTRVSKHVAAPCPASLGEIVAECELNDLRVIRAFGVVPVLSGHTLLVLEKAGRKRD